MQNLLPFGAHHRVRAAPTWRWLLVLSVAACARWPEEQALNAHFVAHRADYERLVLLAAYQPGVWRVSADGVFRQGNDGAFRAATDQDFGTTQRQALVRLISAVGVTTWLHDRDDLLLFPFLAGAREKGIAFSRSPVVTIEGPLTQGAVDASAPATLFAPLEPPWYLYARRVEP
jgi:hypothetical protein